MILILIVSVLLISFNCVFAQISNPANLAASGGGVDGFRFSTQSNTFPLNAIGSGGFPNMGPMGFMGIPEMPQHGNIFGGIQQMSPSQNFFGGGGGGGGGQMPFIPVQQQPQQNFDGGFPMQRSPITMGVGMSQPGSQNRFQGHPKQFGQKQFQPMPFSFQQNSPPLEQQQQRVGNFVQETPTSSSGGGGSLPKFLDGAPEEIITEFKRIIRQPNVTYDDKMKEVEQLVSNNLDETNRKLYHQFMNETDITQQTKKDAIHKTVEGMSEEAQNQFTKISAILQNPNFSSEEEKWNKILTIYGNLEPSLRNEFENKFKPLV